MKKQLLIFAALVFSMMLNAQNKVNLVVFSEDAEPFYAYINGVKQNDKAESNVRITGLSPNISLRIVFENKALPELKQNMALEPGFEHTARIKRDNKQQMKLRYFGQVPMEESASNSGSVPTVAYHSVENTSPAQTETTGQINVTSTTTHTTQSGTGSDNIAVNINMAGVGINMNVTGMEGATMQSSTSTTVTSSSSSNYSSEGSGMVTESRSQPATSSGCSTAMTAPNFEKMKKSIEEKPFSETKMSTAKVATKNNCLSIEQVKQICKLFSMDDDKLAYAKYAYDYCVDKGSYYQVSDVFSFSSTTDEFNKFLEK